MQVVEALVQNAHYAKIGQAADMLKAMVQEAAKVMYASNVPHVPAETIKNATTIVKLANETVAVTFAVYRIGMTIPANTFVAVRKRQAKDLKDSLKAKHGKKDGVLKKLLGEGLSARLEQLEKGDEFEPLKLVATS